MSSLEFTGSLTIVIPCLNEAETLKTVLDKAFYSLSIIEGKGEIIVADNGSTDNSRQIALAAGAKVVDVSQRGYGAALISGITAAKGNFVVMGDADDSYALDMLTPFLIELKKGADLVMGNRFAGGIQPGAMPWLHKYLGNPVLSWLGRVFFKVQIKDFHCGLRAFNRESILSLNLSSSGMEFASEMVVKASLNNLKISEVPTTLSPDGRSRAPHLRTWRDGWRHLIFLLAASPRFLFLYPGLFFLAVGIFGVSTTVGGPRTIAGFKLDLNTYLVSIGFSIVGLQVVLMSILARIFSSRHGILPKTKSVSRFETFFTLERGILVGIGLVGFAFVGLAILLSNWTGSSFESLGTENSLRISGLFILSLCSGIQLIFSSFFASLLQA